MKKFISCFMLLIMSSMCFAGCTKVKEQVLADYLVETNVYTSIDYEFAENYFKENSGRFGGGGCTAVAKKMDNGTALVGRNMDLSYTNKNTYIVRTNEKGKHKTFGFAYLRQDFAPEFEEYKQQGMNETLKKLLPFLCEDVMNEYGLYCEVNMRNDEYEGGVEKFGCDGTNKSATQSVYSLTLPYYICSNCKNIAEAIEYLNTINIYSNKDYWSFAFILADASGNFGLLEIAKNQIYYQPGQNAQANFYVEPTLNAICEHKSGLGRYATVRQGVGSVTNVEQMYNLMDSVKFSEIYKGSNCSFDMRSDAFGTIDVPSFEYLMDDNNRVEVYNKIDTLVLSMQNLTKEQKIANPLIWYSVFTEVADTKNKVIYVRFYEDESLKYKVSFNSTTIWQ